MQSCLVAAKVGIAREHISAGRFTGDLLQYTYEDYIALYKRRPPPFDCEVGPVVTYTTDVYAASLARKTHGRHMYLRVLTCKLWTASARLDTAVVLDTHALLGITARAATACVDTPVVQMPLPHASTADDDEPHFDLEASLDELMEQTGWSDQIRAASV